MSSTHEATYLGERCPEWEPGKRYLISVELEVGRGRNEEPIANIRVTEKRDSVIYVSTAYHSLDAFLGDWEIVDSYRLGAECLNCKKRFVREYNEDGDGVWLAEDNRLAIPRGKVLAETPCPNCSCTTLLFVDDKCHGVFEEGE